MPSIDEKLKQSTHTNSRYGPAIGMLQLSDDEISLYWMEHYHQDEPSRLRRGTVRLDGFASYANDRNDAIRTATALGVALKNAVRPSLANTAVIYKSTPRVQNQQRLKWRKMSPLF